MSQRLQSGVDTQRSWLQPTASLLWSVLYGIRRTSAHSTRSLVTPAWVIAMLFLLFRPCSVAVAHLQLPGMYPRELTIRSMECFLEGRGPMSEKNCSNESHLLQTVIPLAPYLSYAKFLGLEHRCRIIFQMLYSEMELAIPCVILAAQSAFKLSFSPQPQLRVLPDVSAFALTVLDSPQSHLHFHKMIVLALPENSRTTSFPKRRPVRLQKRGCVGSVNPFMTSPFNEGCYGSAAQQTSTAGRTNFTA